MDARLSQRLARYEIVRRRVQTATTHAPHSYDGVSNPGNKRAGASSSAWDSRTWQELCVVTGLPLPRCTRVKWPLAVALLGAVACSSGPIASTPPPSAQAQVSHSTMSPEASANPRRQGGEAGGIESSPSPMPTAQVAKSYAVLVDLFAGRGTYTIALVGSDAQVVAHT